jgi:hypothetical protein
MSIAIESSDELEQLCNRLRKMTDAQLVSFGKAARSLCRDPKCPEVFKRQLEEAKTEWRRRRTRKRSDYLCQAQVRGGRLPRLTLMTCHK